MSELPPVNLDEMIVGDWELFGRVGQGKATRAEVADLIGRLMGKRVKWSQREDALRAIYDALESDANPKAAD